MNAISNTSESSRILEKLFKFHKNQRIITVDFLKPRQGFLRIWRRANPIFTTVSTTMIWYLDREIVGLKKGTSSSMKPEEKINLAELILKKIDHRTSKKSSLGTKNYSAELRWRLRAKKIWIKILKELRIKGFKSSWNNTGEQRELELKKLTRFIDRNKIRFLDRNHLATIRIRISLMLVSSKIRKVLISLLKTLGQWHPPKFTIYQSK